MEKQLAINKQVEAEKLLVFKMLQEKLEFQAKLKEMKSNAGKIKGQSKIEK